MTTFHRKTRELLPKHTLESLEGGDGRSVRLVDSAAALELCDTLTLETRRSLAATFEATLPASLADIAGAARRRDRLGLRRTAQMLEARATTLGAVRLACACQRLEQTEGDSDRDVGDAELEALRATATMTCRALREQLL